MAVTNLVFGARADIKLKHGDHFDGHTWDFSDSAGVAYTWPDDVAALEVRFYEYNGGPQIGTTIDLNNGLSRSSEVVTIQATFAIFDTDSVTAPGDVYYYEMILTTVTGSKHLTPAFGYSTMI